jgi:succinoglycan biosynthesis transport protein ExoP
MRPASAFVRPAGVGLVVRRRWPLLASFVLLGMALSWLVTLRQTPQYAATVTLLINPASPSALVPFLGNSLDSNNVIESVPRLAATYTAFLKSRAFTEQAAARLASPAGGAVSPDDLSRAIRTALVPNTHMLEVQVRWQSPTEAARLANGIADLFATEPAGSDSATVLVRAVPPAVPASPSLLRNLLLGTAIGLALGYALAVLQERRDETVRSEHEVLLLTGLPTLGVIRRPPWSVNGLLGALSRGVPGGPGQNKLLPESGKGRAWEWEAAESYRLIWTVVQLTPLTRDCRTLLVTGPGLGEDTPTVAANLAIVNARAGMRVILVDADLRRPRLHRLFGLEGAAGAERGTKSTKSPALAQPHIVPTRVPGLQLLSAAAIAEVLAARSGDGDLSWTDRSPLGLQQSAEFGQMLDDLLALADLVVVSGPPVFDVEDAAVFGALVHGVVLVADAGRTRATSLQLAAAALNRTAAPLAGVILNGVDPGDAVGEAYHLQAFDEPPAGSDPGASPALVATVDRQNGHAALVSQPSGRSGRSGRPGPSGEAKPVMLQVTLDAPSTLTLTSTGQDGQETTSQP